VQEAKARLLTSLMVDALAPTNFLPTNPAALKHALETGGASLVKGSRNFADGLLNNHGRWLMGQDPPAFDILAWNADSTRMPFAMHSFYLRNFYLENRLARGELEIAGQQVRLGDVKHPAYIVSAENDHIVPWKSAYASARLLAGPARFVLSSGGHIAGIVNPPAPRGGTWSGTTIPARPTNGGPRPRVTTAPGGRTGRPGRPGTPARWQTPRRPEATTTPSSTRDPARTSAPDKPVPTVAMPQRDGSDRVGATTLRSAWCRVAVPQARMRSNGLPQRSGRLRHPCSPSGHSVTRAGRNDVKMWRL